MWLPRCHVLLKDLLSASVKLPVILGDNITFPSDRPRSQRLNLWVVEFIMEVGLSVSAVKHYSVLCVLLHVYFLQII